MTANSRRPSLIGRLAFLGALCAVTAVHSIGIPAGPDVTRQGDLQGRSDRLTGRHRLYMWWLDDCDGVVYGSRFNEYSGDALTGRGYRIDLPLLVANGVLEDVNNTGTIGSSENDGQDDMRSYVEQAAARGARICLSVDPLGFKERPFTGSAIFAVTLFTVSPSGSVTWEALQAWCPENPARDPVVEYRRMDEPVPAGYRGGGAFTHRGHCDATQTAVSQAAERPAPSPPEPQAERPCVLSDGSCTSRTGEACSALGGRWLEALTSCPVASGQQARLTPPPPLVPDPPTVEPDPPPPVEPPPPATRTIEPDVPVALGPCGDVVGAWTWPTEVVELSAEGAISRRTASGAASPAGAWDCFEDPAGRTVVEVTWPGADATSFTTERLTLVRDGAEQALCRGADCGSRSPAAPASPSSSSSAGTGAAGPEPVEIYTGGPQKTVRLRVGNGSDRPVTIDTFDTGPWLRVISATTAVIAPQTLGEVTLVLEAVEDAPDKTRHVIQARSRDAMPLGVLIDRVDVQIRRRSLTVSVDPEPGAAGR